MRTKLLSFMLMFCFYASLCVGQNIRGYIHVTDSSLSPQTVVSRGIGSVRTSDVKMNRILSERAVPVYRQAFPTAKSEWLRNVYYIESPDVGVFDDIENELKGKVDLVELLEGEPVPAAESYTPNDYNILPTGQYDLIHAKEAWAIVKDIPKETIGIIDFYFDTAQVDLCGQFVNQVQNHRNFHDHGTSVTGLIAAIPDNNIGFPGLGFGMKVYAEDIESPPTEQVLKMAQKGYRVINCSWHNSCDYGVVSDSLYKEVLNEWDCIAVFSAGNYDSTGCLPLSSEVYPASYSSVLSVTTVGHANEHGTINSNGLEVEWKDCHEQIIGDSLSSAHHNPAVDICAPGYGVWSTYPMGTGPGNGNYGPRWGTSFAAPLVSATIGLVLSINPCLSAKEAAELVVNTSDPSIYDIPENAPYVGKLGKGRLDVYQAVLAACETATKHIRSPMNYTNSTTLQSNYAIHTEVPIRVLNYANVTYKARREVSFYSNLEVGEGAMFSIYTGMDLPPVCD